MNIYHTKLLVPFILLLSGGFFCWVLQHFYNPLFLSLTTIAPLLIVAIIKFPRLTLLAYIFCFYAIYLIQFSTGGLEAVLGGAMHSGKAGIGVSLNFIIVSLFLFGGAFYILKRSADGNLDLKQYFKNPGALYVSLYGLFVIISLIVQTFVAGEPLSYVLRKGRDVISYPILLIMLWLLFNREDDEKKLLYFSLACFFLVVSTGLFFNLTGKVIVRGGTLFSRLQGIFFGANGSATYLSIFIPFLFYRITGTKGLKKIFWSSALTITIVLTILTWTRAAFIALFIAYLVWIWIEGGEIKSLLKVLALMILLLLSWQVISDHFISDLGYAKSTLEQRVYDIWSPSFRYMFSNYDNSILWFGSPERSFGSILEMLTNKNIAHHNMTLQYLSTYGFFPCLFWILFWCMVIIGGAKTAQKYKISSSQRDILCASTLSLIIYFIMAHSATVTEIYFMNPVIIIVYLLWRARAAVIKIGAEIQL